MNHSLPATGKCPACGNPFVVTARTGAAMGTPDASDALEWRCVVCMHKEVEERRHTDGIDGDWPQSKFDASNALLKAS